eukprot:95788-Alexandrium_andersonii.AAC.1
MSASLVGSEMCIRDSSCPPAAGGGRRGLEQAVGRDRARGADADAAWPVSYTHLTLPTICSV